MEDQNLNLINIYNNLIISNEEFIAWMDSNPQLHLRLWPEWPISKEKIIRLIQRQVRHRNDLIIQIAMEYGRQKCQQIEEIFRRRQ